jgi:hypothetical protein
MWHTLTQSHHNPATVSCQGKSVVLLRNSEVVLRDRCDRWQPYGFVLAGDFDSFVFRRATTNGTWHQCALIRDHRGVGFGAGHRRDGAIHCPRRRDNKRSWMFEGGSLNYITANIRLNVGKTEMIDFAFSRLFAETDDANKWTAANQPLSAD